MILNQLSKWTNENEMKINANKTKYMVINFCKSTQFNTRLYIENYLIEQVNQIRLLGVVLSDDLTWEANTKRTSSAQLGSAQRSSVQFSSVYSQISFARKGQLREAQLSHSILSQISFAQNN